MKPKRSIVLEAGILSVFSLSQCLGGITPAIAKIGEAFPFLPSTTIMYVSTIASLTSIPASLITGQIAGKKMSLRSIAIFSTVLIMVCGCIPAILPASRLTQSASLMASVSICYSIGCMLGGMGFGEIYKRAGNRSMSAALILTAVGMAGSAFAGSILLLCIFIALAGLGFGCLMFSVMTVIGSVTEGRSVAAATSFMMVASNVFTFFCSTWMSLIGRLGGDATYMPLKIGAVIYTILAAILFIHPLYGNNNSFQTSLSQNHLTQKL